MLKKIRESYSMRLIVAVTLLNLISIIIISILFYFTLHGTLNKNYKKITDDMAIQVQSEMSRRLDELKKISGLFAFDRSFYANIGREYDGLERQNILNDYLLVKGNTASVLSDLPMKLKLYVENETIPEHYYIENEDTSLAGRTSFEVMHISKISDTDFYRDFYMSENNRVLKSVDTDIEKGNISLLVKLNGFSAKNEGIFRIQIKLSDLFGGIIGEEFQQSMNYELFDKSGKSVYCDNRAYSPHKSDITAEKTLDEWGLRLLIHMPVKNISAGAWKSFSSLLAAALICFILTIASAYFIRRHLYGDISKILKGIEEFQLGNYEYDIETIGNDEFYQIAGSLNNFAHSTGHLINDVYEVMIQKQDVEFQMLHAKVNPHFLYNIFSIISQMAKAGETEGIVKIVDKTAKFYRSALSKKSEMGTVGSELDILHHYFEIIDIQRLGAVTVEYSIDDNVMQCSIPSFTLQPIVENSIKHAMIDGKIIIKISASYEPRENTLVIVIADNGMGMTDEQIKELFLLRENRGYGLYNINERIRLKYSDAKYNIRCESKYGEGTRIILTLPPEFYMEEQTDV